MASNEVGTAVVKLKFDDSGVDAGLASAEKKTQSFSEKVANTAGKIGKAFTAAFATAAAAAGAAVLKIGKDALKSYADYEQLTGGVETLFKESADIVNDYAEAAYKTAGLSANQYMEQVTSFSASLLQSLDGDTQKAAAAADLAVRDMSDNANKMGTSIESIQSAYQGFAKQNFTMLDNLKLGYGGTRGEMERLIADANKVKVANGQMADLSIDRFADMVEAIHIVQDEMDITGTTALEAEKTISGSLGMVKASWQNLLTFMGGGTDMAWDDVFPAFIDSVKTFTNNIIPVIGDIAENIVNMVADLAPVIIEELPKLLNRILPTVVKVASDIAKKLPAIISQLAPVLAEAFVSLALALVEALPAFVQATLDIIFALADAIIANLPAILEVVTTMVIEIARKLTAPENLQHILDAGLTLMLTLVDCIPDVLVAIIEALPDIIGGIIEFLTDPNNIMKIIEAAVKLFFGIVEAVPKILGALIKSFGELVGKLWEGIKRLFGDFADKFGRFIGDIFKGAINMVLAFIEDFLNAPIRLINGFIGIINDAFGWLGVNIGPIDLISLPRLAQGGVVDSATPVMIGEAGKEAVIPLENNTDNWSGLLAAALAEEMESQEYQSEPITIYMTNKIDNRFDINEVSRGLMEEIRRLA